MARETSMLGHLFSPGGQRGPWDWFPYALDNGAFALWEPSTNSFDEKGWADRGEPAWKRLLFWASVSGMNPLWSIVPDRPGDGNLTVEKWNQYAPQMKEWNCGKLAIAVQDGMSPDWIEWLDVKPDVIAIGGSTEWKWKTVEQWAEAFPHVHVLRCNAPDKLEYLRGLGVKSTDGTGWNRGNRKQTAGLEEYCRRHGKPITSPLWPHVCRAAKDKNQDTFA